MSRLPPLCCALLAALPGLAHADEEGPLPEPHVVGVLQVWATVYDQDTDPEADPAGYGDPEDDIGFKLRRAELGIEGDGPQVRYELTAGVTAPYDTVRSPGNEEAELEYAHLGLKVAGPVWMDAGLQKVPVSRERLISSSELSLAERAVASQWMVPDSQVGLVIDAKGKDQGVRGRGRLGVFNGEESIFGDNNPGKLITARLEGAMGPGSAYATYGKVDKFTGGVGGDFWYDAGIATTTMGYGGDLILRYEGFAFLGEIHMDTISPANSDEQVPGVLEETPRMGMLAQVGYSVKGFEPAFRFSTFDDNKNADDAGDVKELLGGVTWHAKKDHIRLGGGYVARLESDEAVVENNTARLWLQMTL